MAVAIAMLARAGAATYTVTVAKDPHIFRFSGGESQSAVVPPNLNQHCPTGRVLVSDDWAPPPLNSAQAMDAARRPTVRWRNIAPATLLEQSGTARFLAPPQVAGEGIAGVLHDRRWMVPGADHHLVALPDSTLVYQTLMASRDAISPRPAWFDATSRNLQDLPAAGGTMPQFGPGARSTLATWISKDCGKTFTYATEIDSFGAGYEECGNPQPKAACPTCTTAPRPFDMGGTDGHNLVVDRATGRLYSIFQCAGNVLTTDAAGAPALDAAKVDRTYVFSSDDGGKSFTRRGFYKPRLWGPQAVALADEGLALGIGAGLILVQKHPVTGLLDFPSTGPVVEGAEVAWQLPSVELGRRVRVSTGGNTLVAPAPGNSEGLIFGFPSLVEKTTGNPTQGYRLFLYDFGAPDPNSPASFHELPGGIVPTGSAATSAVLHVTAVVATNGGPVLLYWTDLDGATNTARIRGRLLHEGSFDAGATHEDFDIARAGGAAAPFVLTQPGVDGAGKDLRSYFYGDYRTAGAFLDPEVKKSGSATISTYRFYPVWVQPWTTELSGNAPGGSVRFAEVTVTRTVLQPVTFEPELRHKEPDLFVGGECCDFAPLFDRDVARLSREGRALRSALLRADAKLGDSRLRVRTRRAPALVRARTIQAAPVLPPAMREMFDAHGSKRSRPAGGS